MYNTAVRIVNNSQEAEDIMQDAFLSAFSKIKTFKAEVSFGAWLKRIVVNKSLDFLKKRKVLFEEINNNENFEIAEENILTKETALQVKEIKQAITKLADGYRIVLSLYLIRRL